MERLWVNPRTPTVEVNVPCLLFVLPYVPYAIRKLLPRLALDSLNFGTRLYRYCLRITGDFSSYYGYISIASIAVMVKHNYSTYLFWQIAFIPEPVAVSNSQEIKHPDSGRDITPLQCWQPYAHRISKRNTIFSGYPIAIFGFWRLISCGRGEGGIGQDYNECMLFTPILKLNFSRNRNKSTRV